MSKSTGVERLMVAMGIASLVLLTVCTLLFYSNQSFLGLINHVELERVPLHATGRVDPRDRRLSTVRRERHVERAQDDPESNRRAGRSCCWRR